MMGSWNSPLDDKKKDMLEIIAEFLSTSSSSDALQIFEQHPELLSEEADSILSALSEDALSEETSFIIQNCRYILAHCRKVGIDKAFKEISSPSNEIPREDLQIILEDIDSLSKQEDIPRKIMLLQHTLSIVKRKSDPTLWAFLQVKLGNSLAHNSLENISSSVEKAIKHFNYAQKVYTYQDFPVEWAAIQNNIAATYGKNTLGDRVKNIEKAIEHCNHALKVYTLQNFPEMWAKTQTNLVNAYLNRIHGNKAENIELVIEHCNQSLKVYTRNDFPAEWAKAQTYLAIAYWNRIMGDKTKNIEKSIECYNKSLKVYTYQDFPAEWAMIQNNLSITYWSRTLGDKAENIEQAIDYCNQALNVYTHHDFPEEWAMTQNSLAAAFGYRIRGHRAENIEIAIEHCYQALKVRTQKDSPVYWAETQNNLAVAYSYRVKGERAENIEKAIKHYNKALEVRTQLNFPESWAETLNNLASIYLYRIRGDRAENIEKAIEYFNHSLKVYTSQNYPNKWAGIQNNLANAYINRINGDNTKNIELAIGCFHNALKITKLESMPNDFRRICRLLGDLYFDKGQWGKALKCYRDAIKAGDLLYWSGLSAESKKVEVKNNSHIYRNASMVACSLGFASEALLILEKGKTRLHTETLRLKMKKPKGILNKDWMKYEESAEKYRTVLRFFYKEEFAQREKEVKKALEDLQSSIKIIQMYDPKFQNELDILDILSIPNKDTALLTFCITDKGSIGFIISESCGVQSVNIPSFKEKDLVNLLFKPDGHGSITGGWVGDYQNYLKTTGTSCNEDAFVSWKITIADILSYIGTNLLYPLLEKLPLQIKRLILLPSGDLFLLPLHAISLPDKQLLCQNYCVSYAPSIPLLIEMKSKAETIKEKGLYAIINPQDDPALVFSECEGKMVSKFFQSSLVNIGETGTIATILDNLPRWAYLHFSCHGSYNWNNPPQSRLYLVGGRTLSLDDLQNGVVSTSSTRLVTLSACETGITDVLQGSADEFVGLPAGFIIAGIPCVVSSLWSVPDISTALLMERFYSNHIVGGMDIPMALQDAQLWVRDLSSKQVMDYVEKCYRSSKWEGKSKEYIEQYRQYYLKIAKESPDKKPFQHPYYWAAFTVNGA
jgi:CHAT domain-containing protein